MNDSTIVIQRLEGIPEEALAEVQASLRAVAPTHPEERPIQAVNIADWLLPSAVAYEASRRLFGSWPAAVEKAGLNYEEATGVQRWTKNKVVEAIRQLAARGLPLSARYLEPQQPSLFHAAVKRFPSSWAKALQAAGLDPDEHRAPRGRWNRPSAEDWVRSRVARGRSILARAAPSDLVNYVQRRLATAWTDFVESLGIPYPGIKKRRDWSKQTLLEEIRCRSAEGRRLNYRAVKLEHQALIH